MDLQCISHREKYFKSIPKYVRRDARCLSVWTMTGLLLGTRPLAGRDRAYIL